MNKDTVRQIVNILAVIATLTVNALANILPLNGHNTGAISDSFKVYFVPAGYVFAIWGVIYLLLIIFAVYQALPAQRSNPRLRQIGYLFVLSCLANIAWIFFWHYEIFILTFVAMLVLLACLTAIYLRLGTGVTQVSSAESWAVRLTFSVYLGWISVATIANVTDVLDYLKWNGWGISPVVWTVIILAVVVALSSIISLTRRDIAYLLVILWALAGIAIKQSAQSVVSTSAWVALGLVFLVTLVGVMKKRQKILVTS
jgi:benzodiazapine receptor